MCLMWRQLNNHYRLLYNFDTKYRSFPKNLNYLKFLMNRLNQMFHLNLSYLKFLMNLKNQMFLKNRLYLMNHLFR